MACKTKKEASDAIDSLQQYLRRDAGGLRMLGQLSRYVGELRQEKSRLKGEVDSLSAGNESLIKRATSAEAECFRLRDELNAESSKRKQAECALSLQRSQVAAREDSAINAPIDGELVSESEDRWWQVFRDLRRRIPTPPFPVQVVNRPEVYKKPIYVFDPGHISHGLNYDGLLTLGMFAAVVSLSFQGIVAFIADPNDREGIKVKMKKFSDNRQRKYFRWIMEWLSKDHDYVANTYLPTERELREGKMI